MVMHVNLGQGCDVARCMYTRMHRHRGADRI